MTDYYKYIYKLLFLAAVVVQPWFRTLPSSYPCQRSAKGGPHAGWDLSFIHESTQNCLSMCITVNRINWTALMSIRVPA